MSKENVKETVGSFMGFTSIFFVILLAIWCLGLTQEVSELRSQQAYSESRLTAMDEKWSRQVGLLADELYIPPPPPE